MSDIIGRLNKALAERYRVERELGEGGMATVYLAHDDKLDREVALKVLRPEMSEALGTERFLREIHTTAGLRHPNILPLYDSGEAAGLLYYVMPRVEGESLRDRMEREGKLPLDEALRLAAEVCAALAYAHGRGVIHRDIKPDNILLENGHALVADFGIAIAVAAAGAERLTQTGIPLGTPLYISPEQASGDPDLDGRTDLYSFGCVLYEMITGRPPFSGPTPEAILVQRFTAPPPKLSAVRGTAPPRLEAALTRAMARDRAERFTGVEAFAQALAAAPARNTAVPEPSIAVLPFTNMGGGPEDEYFSDGVSDEITNVLSRMGGLRVAARTSAFAFKGAREDLRVVGEKLNVATVLEGSVRRAGNRVRITVQLVDVADGYHLWSERYDRELTDIFAIQDEIAAAVAEALKVTLVAGGGEPRAGTASLEAYDLYLQGRAAQLRRGAAVVTARDLFERAVSLDPDYVDALAMLADSSRLMGLYGMARPNETMPRAKEAAESALSLQPNHAEALATLADVSMIYDFDEVGAAAYWERALEADPGHTRARCERAMWLISFYRGASDRAAAEGARAVEADPLNAWAVGMHALMLVLAGRVADAERQAIHSIELDESSFLAHWTLQITRLWGGDPEGSVEAARTALLMSGRSPFSLGFLAEAYGAMGERSRAAAVRAELEARASADYVAAGFRAGAAIAAGDLDGAAELLQLAVEERDGFALMAVRRPLWEPLREHPRFWEIMAPTGLTPSR